MKHNHIINRTGKEEGSVNLVATIWSDRELRKYVDICKQLNLGQHDTLGDLTTETDVEFVKAFYPSFDEDRHIATLLREVDRSNGFPVYLIEIWEPE